MNFIGDYFAIGIIIVLALFFYDRRLHLTKASQYYVTALILTALTALTDLMTGHLLTVDGVPLWTNLLVNSLYFLINIIATSFLALFLFTKTLEHSHNTHCMRYAKIGLGVLLVVYVIAILLNLWTGVLFYFDAQGNYHRGPCNGMGYIITICQMMLVLVCFFRNRKNASKSMRRVLIQAFPVAVICIIIQRVFPEIMLNGYILALFDTVLFMTFQGQRQGVHTLTKLNDRHSFFRDVQNRLAKQEPFQAFLINIKNYSEINQKYGHLFGDEVLYHFAFSLENLFKNSTAFHMNGTVFALLIPYSSQKNAEDHTTTLLGFLDDGIPCIDEIVHTDYILVEYPISEQQTDAELFYEQLEYAASIAFQEKCRYIRCTPELGKQMERSRYLIERMHTIDREHGFQVWFQPICCLHTGSFCSMEALVRLQEPDGSIVSPAEFIPIAEKTGILPPLTWFVLENSCELLAAHKELGNVSVSINLPMAQLLERGFTTRLNSIVDHYGIDHQRICLEFTEREILDTFAQTKTIMEQLTLEGYRFYLDDFGTGYSNFSCMMQLPFQFLKLDSSLIHTAGQIPQAVNFVQTLTKLSHDMGMQVIAEGVETQESAAILGSQGVDRIQGYVFAKPMPQQKLLDFYKNNPQ